MLSFVTRVMPSSKAVAIMMRSKGSLYINTLLPRARQYSLFSNLYYRIVKDQGQFSNFMHLQKAHANTLPHLYRYYHNNPCYASVNKYRNACFLPHLAHANFLVVYPLYLTVAFIKLFNIRRSITPVCRCIPILPDKKKTTPQKEKSGMKPDLFHSVSFLHLFTICSYLFFRLFRRYAIPPDKLFLYDTFRSTIFCIRADKHRNTFFYTRYYLATSQ